MSYLFYLIGPPGSGKRTVGKQLSQLTGAALLDNHLFNDAVFRPYGADGLRPIPPEIRALAAQVVALGLEAARLAPQEISHILTSYLTAQPSGAAAFERVRQLALSRGAAFVPVWLDCDPGELARRMTLPERLERAKMRSPAALKELLDSSGIMSAPPEAIKINSAELSAQDSALLIATHAGALF